MSELIFCNPFISGGLILIETTVLEVIGSYRQDNTIKPEAGGLLLGFRRNHHIHVVTSTTPKPRDVRSRFKFHRRDQRHQVEAEKLWVNSGKKIDFLGEWHTHPEEFPSPSIIDLRGWSQLSKPRCEPLIFVIGSMSLEHSYYCALRGKVMKLSN